MAAVFAKANYILNEKKANRSDRIDKAQNAIPDSYVVHPKSGKDVALFISDDKKHSVISHRGTDLTNKKDLTADLSFLLGLEKHNKEFKKRERHTQKLLKLVPDDHSVSLQGHSYGGASALQSAKNNSKIRNKVDEIVLYNPLTHGEHVDDIATAKGESQKAAKKDLNSLVTTHRTKNDLVSAKKTQYGKTKTHKQKSAHKSIPVTFRSVFNTLDQLNAHSLNNF